jgi:hypothetical protein
MLFDERNEVGGGVAGQSRLGEVGIGGEEVFGLGVEVGEIAASAAGDKDFFAKAVGVVEEDDTAVAASGFDSTHEACCASAEDECVEGVGHLGQRTSGAKAPVFLSALMAALEALRQPKPWG